MIKCTTALLASLILAGCTGTDTDIEANPGPERVEAWQTVESYKIDERMNILRAGQWLREPGNEGKSREEAEAALELETLDPGPAVEAALEIARADPTDDRMDLPFVNWFVGVQSKLYDDWSIQGVPTYIAVDRDGLVLGRSHDVESLYDVILEAAGADEATRAELAGDGVATP